MSLQSDCGSGDSWKYWTKWGRFKQWVEHWWPDRDTFNAIGVGLVVLLIAVVIPILFYLFTIEYYPKWM